MKAAEEMSSSDEESYREKFENIKWLVNTLQRQLHEEQLRSKGVEALSACLEEEREKSQKLTEQKKKQERGIMVLQSRLEKHGLDSSLTLEEGEFLRPGSSRSLLENLMAENAKLKRNQKYLNVDPARLEQALQDIEKQKNHIKQLESTLQILREELDKAKTQLRASDSDKDKQILSLEAHVAELKRNKDTQSVLCHSLSAETTSLRQQLKDTMKQMQETMRRLELNDSDKDHSASSKELATAHAQLQELQHELEARNSRLQEVTDMNTRWQTYNKQRDQYVQELKQRLSEKQTPPENTDSLKTTIDQLQQKVQSLEQMKTQLEENNRQLRQRVEALQERNSTILDQEKANLYEAQIKLITEDFKQERDDRAREHERAEKLEKELSEVKAELDSLQRQNMQEFADRRQKSLENYEQQYYQNMYGNSAAGRLRNIGAQQAAFVTRGVRYECDDDLQQDSVNDEERSEDVVDTPTDDVLQCPKCNKCFPMDQHAELIEHLDQC